MKQKNKNAIPLKNKVNYLSKLNAKWKELFSIKFAKHPRITLLVIIVLANLIFFLLAALIISSLSLRGTEKMGFLEAAFYTVTMILDAGCISYVVEDIGSSGVAISVFCLTTVIVGMITFTGALIGYITNVISNLIDQSDSGSFPLNISGHIVILNWNSRAAEIINEYMLSAKKEKVIVLVKSGRAEIENEIRERLDLQIKKERQLNPKYKSRLIWLVREGDVFSSKQLNDISLLQAKSIIILGNDIANQTCKYEMQHNLEEQSQGNALTVKTLMQVADITSDSRSRDDQNIIVEITDEWTSSLVDKIIRQKTVAGKCNILPLPVNAILGSILSQFSIMPELNAVYDELFSNEGARFFARNHSALEADTDYISGYLANHRDSIPLTSMEVANGKENKRFFYMAIKDEDLDETAETDILPSIRLTEDFQLEKRYVIILGHNSRCKEIMDGFKSFNDEWKNKDGNIVEIRIVDDEEHLKKMPYYGADGQPSANYKFLTRDSFVLANVYDKEATTAAIESFIDAHPDSDTSVLILSDDNATKDNMDANAIANLVYVQEIVTRKVDEAKEKGETFDVEKIDIIVELLDPKHVELVNSYGENRGKIRSNGVGSNNVIISNKYVSKMITQIGEEHTLYEFYKDILTYDSADGTEDLSDEALDSKEIYVKKVKRFLKAYPGADEYPEGVDRSALIRGIYENSRNNAHLHPSILLGYITRHGKDGTESDLSNVVVFFGRDDNGKVILHEDDKLIIFSEH